MLASETTSPEAVNRTAGASCTVAAPPDGFDLSASALGGMIAGGNTAAPCSESTRPLRNLVSA
eukprot:3449027-Alexandrium_andersonii.AAC.1